MTRRRQIQDGTELFEEFAGRKPRRADELDHETPEVVIQVGSVVGIQYETTRDGETAEYYHEFRRKSRPILCVGTDGQNLLIVGGRYEFTDHGIEDR